MKWNQIKMERRTLLCCRMKTRSRANSLLMEKLKKKYLTKCLFSSVSHEMDKISILHTNIPWMTWERKKKMKIWIQVPQIKRAIMSIKRQWYIDKPNYCAFITFRINFSSVRLHQNIIWKVLISDHKIVLFK